MPLLLRLVKQTLLLLLSGLTWCCHACGDDGHQDHHSEHTGA
jgi:hypothetical protein